MSSPISHPKTENPPRAGFFFRFADTLQMVLGPARQMPKQTLHYAKDI
jgi:hypothetical protein